MKERLFVGTSILIGFCHFAILIALAASIRRDIEAHSLHADYAPGFGELLQTAGVWVIGFPLLDIYTWGEKWLPELDSERSKNMLTIAVGIANSAVWAVAIAILRRLPHRLFRLPRGKGAA